MKPVGADRGRPWVPVALFIAALTVRLVFVAEQSGAPLFEFRGVDADRYHEMAVGWLQGLWPGGRAFDWPPLYPIFLGSVYQWFGQDVVVIKSVQALIGAASCVLIYGVSWEIFRRRSAAIVAASIACFCGTLIYFDTELLSANLDLFLQLLSLYLLLRAAATGKLGGWALAGGVLALAAINRGGALIFLPVIIVWIFLLPRWQQPSNPAPSARARWLQAALVVIPVLLSVALVGWHNTRYDLPLAAGGKRLGAVLGPSEARPFAETVGPFLAGGFLRTGSVVGFNLYLGNDWSLREANDVRQWGSLQAIGRVYHEPFENGAVTLAEHDQYLRRKTFDVIADAPADWLRALARKGFQVVHGDEIPRNRQLYADREHSVVLAALLWKHVIAFPSGLLIPLGMLGVFLARSRWRAEFPLLGLVAVQLAMLMGFFVTARYRTPFLALMAIYAGFAVVALPDYLKRQGSSWGKALPLALLASLLIASNFRVGTMRVEPFSFEFRGYARQLRAEGRLTEAIEQYRAAVQVGGDEVEPHLGLGGALAEQGNPREAAASFAKAVAIAPDEARGWMSLGAQYLALRQPDDAIRAIERVLTIDPDMAEAHHNLALAFAQAGRGEEARFHRREARRLRRSAE